MRSLCFLLATMMSLTACGLEGVSADDSSFSALGDHYGRWDDGAYQNDQAFKLVRECVTVHSLPGLGVGGLAGMELRDAHKKYYGSMGAKYLTDTLPSGQHPECPLTHAEVDQAMQQNNLLNKIGEEIKRQINLALTGFSNGNVSSTPQPSGPVPTPAGAIALAIPLTGSTVSAWAIPAAGVSAATAAAAGSIVLVGGLLGFSIALVFDYPIFISEVDTTLTQLVLPLLLSQVRVLAAKLPTPNNTCMGPATQLLSYAFDQFVGMAGNAGKPGAPMLQIEVDGVKRPIEDNEIVFTLGTTGAQAVIDKNAVQSALCSAVNVPSRCGIDLQGSARSLIIDLYGQYAEASGDPTLQAVGQVVEEVLRLKGVSAKISTLYAAGKTIGTRKVGVATLANAMCTTASLPGDAQHYQDVLQPVIPPSTPTAPAPTPAPTPAPGAPAPALKVPSRDATFGQGGTLTLADICSDECPGADPNLADGDSSYRWCAQDASCVNAFSSATGSRNISVWGPVWRNECVNTYRNKYGSSVPACQ